MIEYKICSKCIMDTSDPDITFNSQGECNHCQRHETWKKSEISLEQKSIVLKNKIDRIKKKGKHRKYDCIIGLSGGVDSSYVAYLVKELGLRPLAVHLDNGWNSEAAVQNIKSIVDKLGIDLYTHVINWKEFKDMQRAFFKASVVDIELLTDNSIMGTMINQAMKFNVKYIITGMNVATEFYPLPVTWRHYKYDTGNIKTIQRKFGTIRSIKTFPFAGIYHKLYRQAPWTVNDFNILDYVEYKKKEVIHVLKDKLGWVEYGQKHFESIFTKIYQVYILPKKFGFEKRRTHLSSLIWSNQISREEALAEISKPQVSELELEQDIEFLCKKLDFSREEFDDIMNQPPVPHEYYKNDMWKHRLIDRMLVLPKKIYRWIKY